MSDYFSLAHPEPIVDWLRSTDWLGADESCTLTSAGPGNMNLTMRATRADGATIIVKQARPWVEKYPDIPAPETRAAVEAAFYTAVSNVASVAGTMPQCLGYDARLKLLTLQDLGAGADLSTIYEPTNHDAHAPLATLVELTHWLSALHSIPVTEALIDQVGTNSLMRELNHEHIFDLPLRRDNGLDLNSIDAGLHDHAQALINDSHYVARVAQLAEMYLAAPNPDAVLLHGDFYPGSWLRTADGIRIIDPEFAFIGPAEFDIGVMQAHLILATYQAADLDAVLATYRRQRPFDASLAAAFAGVELMRRLIGVAQLPMIATLAQKVQWLNTSVDLVNQWQT